MTTSQYIEALSTNKLIDRTKLSNSKVRGFAFISTLNFIKENYSKSELEKFISNLDISIQILLRKKIDPLEWYNFSDLIDINQQMIQQLFKGDQKRVKEMGVFTGNSLVKGINGLKIKFSSIDKVAITIKKTLETYFLPANVKIELVEEKHVQIKIADFFDPTESVIYRFTGIISAFLEKNGRKNVIVQFSKCCKTEDCYIIQAIWA